MARRYTISFEKVAVTAVQDLFQVKGAAGKIVNILGVELSSADANPIATAQMLATRCRYLPATVTDGSGGSTPTPSKVDPGDAAASLTALANNTTKATTSGTAVTLREKGVHVYAGDTFTFPTPIPIGPTESFVYELITATNGTVTMNGTVYVEEIGG